MHRNREKKSTKFLLTLNVNSTFPLVLLFLSHHVVIYLFYGLHPFTISFQRRFLFFPDSCKQILCIRYTYSVFQGFRQSKSANGSLILSLSYFLILPQLPQIMKLASKVVKVDSKIINSLPKI
jgi:hypothetical protein